MSVFCRHNRFTADCPICSKGTALDHGRRPARRSPSGAAPRAKAESAVPRAFSGRYVSVGPYWEGEDRYEVRLERVPGGVRPAEWDGTGLRRRAPVLAAEDVAGLVERAAEVLEERDATRMSEALEAAPGSAGPEHEATGPPGDTLGLSRGRSGDFKEELRLEAVGDGRVRIGRWLLRPGSGWQLQEAPPMLPAARYAEVIAQAARRGIPSSASDAGGASRL